MLLINALKTLCDFLLYFTFAGLLPPYMESWTPVISCLGLALISSLILQKAKDTIPTKLFCSFLPALSLWTAHTIPEIIITAVILTFYIVLIFSGRNIIHYEDYKYWFGIPAIPALVVFIICTQYWPVRPVSAVCSGLYLFLGLLVLRRKRIGGGITLKLKLMNLAEMAAITISGVLVCALLYTIITHSGKVFEILLLPFALLFNIPIFIIGLIFDRYNYNEFAKEERESYAAPTGTWIDFTEVLPKSEEPGDIDFYKRLLYWAQVAIAVLALILLLYLLYRFHKLMRNIRLESTAQNQEVEESSQDPLLIRHIRNRKKKKLPAMTNNEKIRHIYKEYLSLVKSHGVEISRQTTSQDVMVASDNLADPRLVKRLRDLYIHARYQDAKELSSADVEQAREILNSIREQLK